MPHTEHHIFKGRISADYVGTPSKQTSFSKYPDAPAFSMHIYRATIKEFERLETIGDRGDDGFSSLSDQEKLDHVFPFYPKSTEAPRLRQSSIEDTIIHDESSFTGHHQGPVYDVLVDAVEVKYSTIKGRKTYGRIEGEVYGRFILEHSSSAEDPIDSEGKNSSQKRNNNEKTMRPSQGRTTSDDPKVDDAAEAPMTSRQTPTSLRANIPLLFWTIVITLLLGFGIRLAPALLWTLVAGGLLVIRSILAGQFESRPWQKIAGACLVLIQLASWGCLVFHWNSLGCKSIHIGAAIGIALTLFIATFLPSPKPVAATGLGFAALLALAFSPLGNPCQVKDAPSATPVKTKPSVQGPGSPRTNDDGSWPRRPPG